MHRSNPKKVKAYRRPRGTTSNTVHEPYVNKRHKAVKNKETNR